MHWRRDVSPSRRLFRAPRKYSATNEVALSYVDWWGLLIHPWFVLIETEKYF
jgi:hypothetical protein